MAIKILNTDKSNDWSDNWSDDSVFNRSGKESTEFKQNGLNVFAEIKSEPCAKTTSFSMLKKSIADLVNVVLTAKNLLQK